MRVSGVEEFATLAVANPSRLGERTCMVPAGTAVRVIGRPTNLADKGVGSMLFVRVAAGPCDGYELTVEERALIHFRATMDSAPAASSPASRPAQ